MGNIKYSNLETLLIMTLTTFLSLNIAKSWSYLLIWANNL